MSGGTEVLANGMMSPSFSGGEVALRGNNSTYDSPIAVWLCTSALRSDGISMPDFSDNTAWTPVSVSRTDSTRPTSKPR